MIVCEDVVRVFQGDGIEIQALQGLSLRVEEGELVAVVGASGSGKSTLLGVLGAHDAPSAGRAVVAGHDLGTLDRRGRQAYRRDVVGFVWQQTGQNLVAYLTARENVELPMLVAGRRGRAQRTARAEELLELLEVGGLGDRLPRELSGGQQQRVAIAVALANGPQVLLADEPTGQLDEATSVDVIEAIHRVNRELGVTALVVTHDRAVSDHVTRTVQLRDGRVSSEVMRHSSVHHLAEELTVIDKVGRLQLPREYVERLGLADRVRLTLEVDHVQVHPGDRPSPADRDLDPGTDAPASAGSPADGGEAP